MTGAIKKPTILIVDDEPLNIQLLSDIFKTEYKVILANNGSQALKITASQKIPDIILLDIMMPVMDGYEVCKRLKADSRTNNIPVIFISAKMEEEDELKGFEVGGVDYITKPFSRRITMARVKTQLQKHAARQKLDLQPERMMAGNLEDIGLPDLLQSMETGSKTAQIRFEEIDAEIIVRNGYYVAARHGKLVGDAALTCLFLQDKGKFTVTFETVSSDEYGEERSLSSLLLVVLAHLELGTDTAIVNHPHRLAVIKNFKKTLLRIEPYQRTEGVMKGDLTDINLVELLQNMEQGVKTAAVFLNAIDGEIYIQDGNFIHIQQGKFTGDYALTRIFLLENGAFTVKFNELPAKITEKPQMLMTVLMNTLAYVDDLKDKLKSINAEKVILNLFVQTTGFTTIDAHAAHFPFNFTELLVLMDGELKQNFNLILHAIRNKKIRASRSNGKSD
ncbi:response regulator [Desulfococcaceae bacterium HSG9]|nr:response regulator [Desulfococcaceae bacterium HSG9]